MILTPNGTELTEHAVESMLERNVPPHEVDDVLRWPEHRYFPTAIRYEPGSEVLQRRDIAVVTTGRGKARKVITVLYREQNGATAAEWAPNRARDSGRCLSANQRRRLTAQLRRAQGAA